MNRPPVTRESLQKDKERREREREKLATVYEDAAAVLRRENDYKFWGVIKHLKDEAKRWRR